MGTRVLPFHPHRLLPVSLAAAFGLAAVSCAHGQVSFNWATVGNPGNAPDPLNAAALPGIGSVGSEYRIATTEVSNDQYIAFLNAADAPGTNPNGIYNSDMGSDTRGGIAFNAAAPAGSKYSARPNMGNKPVNFVSFPDCMRFVNWLHNGQGAGGTESGVYAISNGLAELRSAAAQYFIPTQNEWYKAAYHQPASQGGDSDHYWLYATRSNTVPTIATATALGDIANPGPNVVNYASGADWNGLNGNETTVGSAGPLSASFYGTFDQAGNLFEWNETVFSGNSRGIRGASWGHNEFALRSSAFGFDSPAFEGLLVGFRVGSSVPGPAPASLLALCGLACLRRGRIERH